MTDENQTSSSRKKLGLILTTFFLTGLSLHLINERRAEEDWAAYKEAAAARDEHLEWNLAIPTPPPDADNFYAVPVVQKWMPKKGTEPTGFGGIQYLKARDGGPVELVESRNTAPRLPDASNLPAPITIKSLRSLPTNPKEGEQSLESLHLWFEQWKFQFEQFRTAGKRSAVYLPGDYSSAPSVPIQNFVAARSLAQAIAAKAKVNLTLGHPGEARKDLESLECVIRGMETRPVTMVAAMIRCALAGIYQDVAQEGLVENLWKPEQIKSIQQYLARFDLLKPVQQSIMQGERVGIAHILDMEGRAIARTFSGGPRNSSKVQEVIASLYPRSLIRRNQLYICGIYDESAAILNPVSRRYHPNRSERLSARLEKEMQGFHPTRMLASVVIPNFSKAFETGARNQAYIDLSAVAFALEAFKSASGSYPSNLNQLTPTYFANVPRDIVTAQPLKYKAATANSFVLYATGVDGKDDGASPKSDFTWPRVNDPDKR